MLPQSLLFDIADQIRRLKAEDRDGVITIEVPLGIAQGFQRNLLRTNLQSFCGADPESLLITNVSWWPPIVELSLTNRGWNNSVWSPNTRLMGANGVALYPPIDFAQLEPSDGDSSCPVNPSRRP